MKKMKIGNGFYDVVSMDEYTKNNEIYCPRDTLIETSSGYVLPIKTRANDNGPGIQYQPGAMVCYVNTPTSDAYSTKHIIDLSNPANIQEVFDKQAIIRDIQDEIVTTADNILCLKVGDSDTPEMATFKKALNAKHMDTKPYKDRFDQYNNDMRLIRGSSITLDKLASIASNFDMSVDLIIRDSSPDVPNPMKEEFIIDITNGRGGDK